GRLSFQLTGRLAEGGPRRLVDDRERQPLAFRIPRTRLERVVLPDIDPGSGFARDRGRPISRERRLRKQAGNDEDDTGRTKPPRQLRPIESHGKMHSEQLRRARTSTENFPRAERASTCLAREVLRFENDEGSFRLLTSRGDRIRRGNPAIRAATED